MVAIPKTPNNFLTGLKCNWLWWDTNRMGTCPVRLVSSLPCGLCVVIQAIWEIPFGMTIKTLLPNNHIYNNNRPIWVKAMPCEFSWRCDCQWSPVGSQRWYPPKCEISWCVEWWNWIFLNLAKKLTIRKVAPDHLVPTELDSPHQGQWWKESIFLDGSHLFHAREGFNVWNFVSKPFS